MKVYKILIGILLILNLYVGSSNAAIRENVIYEKSIQRAEYLLFMRNLKIYFENIEKLEEEKSYQEYIEDIIKNEGKKLNHGG